MCAVLDAMTRKSTPARSSFATPEARYSSDMFHSQTCLEGGIKTCIHIILCHIVSDAYYASLEPIYKLGWRRQPLVQTCSHHYCLSTCLLVSCPEKGTFKETHTRGTVAVHPMFRWNSGVVQVSRDKSLEQHENGSS